MSIEEYLRELERRLRVGPLRRRRIVRELEAHLLDAAAEEEASGLSRQEAERVALDRLGSVDDLAARFGATRRSVPVPRLTFAAATVVVVAATCVVVSVGVTLGLRAGSRTTSSAVPTTRAAVIAYARRVSLARERVEATNIARTVCGGKQADRRCVAEAVTNLFRDRAFRRPCKDPALVYVGNGTWQTPGSRMVPAPGGGGRFYFSACYTVGG